MQTTGLVRACCDVYRIGKIQFATRKFVIEHFMKVYKITQKYQQSFAISTFYFMTNNNNRAWLVNITKVYQQPDQVGGLYQVVDKTFIMENLDYALVPSFMYPRNGDFSFLNLLTLFMWMTSYPKLILDHGLRPVCSKVQEEEYINVKSFFIADFE